MGDARVPARQRAEVEWRFCGVLNDAVAITQCEGEYFSRPPELILRR